MKFRCFLIFLLYSTNLFSQNGSTSFSFLNIETSPRSIAMGGDLISVFDNDITLSLLFRLIPFTPLELLPLNNLILRGLMAIPSKINALKENINSYKILKSEYDRLQHKYKSFNTLSIGMSNDYKLAIDNGSNMVRIGSLIFGERK